MRRFRSLLPIALLSLAIACKPADAPPATEPAGTVYGEKPTLTDTTALADVLADPARFVGQRLLVAGTVVEVCEKRGCWLTLGSEGGHETLRVKVEDGVIIFPMSARGHHALVEGTMEKVELSAEEARAQAKKHAEESGAAFDSTATFGPTTSYQLRGLGAIITE